MAIIGGVGWIAGAKYHSNRASKALKKKHMKEAKTLYSQYYNDVYKLQEQNAELAQAVQQLQIALQNAGIQGSMSRRANCWDNTVAESFFGTIKMEFIHRMTFADHAEAKTAISEWIEVFYNRQRIHSTIGFLSPVQFEEDYWLSLSQPVAA